MRLLRFERKIVLAIVAVAAVSLGGAVFLGRIALSEVYAIGVNAEVRQELDSALEVYRKYLRARRAEGELLADKIAADLSAAIREEAERQDVWFAGRAAIVADEAVRNELVGRVVADGWPATAENRDRLDPRRFRLVTEVRFVPGPDPEEPIEVDVTLAMEADTFARYERLGQVRETYARIDDARATLSFFYLAAYVGCLAVVLLVAVLVVSALARRVTRRVGALAEATTRVGAGDLQVEVPSGGRDEIAELTRAFNRMVRDLRSSRDRIEYLQRISAWQEFARRLAHEIKNPLTPIQLAVQDLQQAYDRANPAFAAKLDETRSIVEEEVATLRRLVGTFSAFGRLPVAQLTDADLGEFVRDQEKALRTTVLDTAPGIELSVDTGGMAAPVQIDPMMLRRVLDNLVRNAAEALRDRGRDRGRIDLRVRLDGARAVLEVQDDGPGLPPGQGDRVFDPYFTTKDEGTGLGLAIAKKIVLEHGGEISADTALPTGALFRIALPVRAKHHA